jgi:hypothetical protein
VARARRKVIEVNEYQKYLPNSYQVAEARGYDKAVWHEFAKQNDLPTSQSELSASIQRKTSGTSNIPIGYNADGEYIGSADPRVIND